MEKIAKKPYNSGVRETIGSVSEGVHPVHCGYYRAKPRIGAENSAEYLSKKTDLLGDLERILGVDERGREK